MFYVTNSLPTACYADHACDCCCMLTDQALSKVRVVLKLITTAVFLSTWPIFGGTHSTMKNKNLWWDINRQPHMGSQQISRWSGPLIMDDLKSAKKTK
jgi:hypothetical protein